MKTYTDAIRSLKIIFKNNEYSYNDVKAIFLTFKTSYKSKKRFVAEFSPSFSFSGFHNLRNLTI
jgi:hypothetical protein